MRPAVTVTAHPRRKEATTEESFPTAEMVKPLYRPWMPSDFRVFTYTSIRPLNWRSPPLPLASLASLVLAKSREYTKRRDRVPAAPPEAMLVANLVAGEASLGVANRALMVSLKAKF